MCLICHTSCNYYINAPNTAVTTSLQQSLQQLPVLPVTPLPHPPFLSSKPGPASGPPGSWCFLGGWKSLRPVPAQKGLGGGIWMPPFSLYCSFPFRRTE